MKCIENKFIVLCLHLKTSKETLGEQRLWHFSRGRKAEGKCTVKLRPLWELRPGPGLPPRIHLGPSLFFF
jgi:hypothetical protein